jgi:hypothetical protein
MSCKRELIVKRGNLGSVTLCRHCQQVHVSVGPVTLRLHADAYAQLVEMLNASMPALRQSAAPKAQTAAGCGENELVH